MKERSNFIGECLAEKFGDGWLWMIENDSVWVNPKTDQHVVYISTIENQHKLSFFEFFPEGNAYVGFYVYLNVVTKEWDLSERDEAIHAYTSLS